MRNIIKSFLVLSATLILSSCTREETNPITNTQIPCTINNENHPKANAYQEIIDDFAMDGFVGISMLVDDPADGTWSGSSGFARLEDRTEMNPCHLHYTASIYKTYVASIIMQMVDENKVGLDEKLTTYLGTDITDRLPNGKDISIRNLLQHRTGLQDIFEVEFITDFFNNPTDQYTILDLLAFVYDTEPLSPVDTEFYYSDANFALLTLVIEALEGDFADVLEQRIFRPLGLNDTYFLKDNSVLPSGLADSYWDRYSDGKIENNTEVQLALATGLLGTEGVISTLEDLKVYIKALGNGQITNDISVMTDFVDVPQEIKDTRVYSAYGMGLMKVQISGEEWYGHFGNQVGSGAIVLYNADKDITMVALQNTGTFFSDSIKEKFFYRLLNKVEGVLF